MSSQIIGLIMYFVLSPVQSLGTADECDRMAAMEVYSNAFAHAETGDVLGYELAMKWHKESTVDALLYLYEGAPNKDAIPLSGRVSEKHLKLQGDWAEHLIEYPSNKQIVEKHFVKIDGILESASFNGKVTIEGMREGENVRLKHVKTIWLCR